MKFGQNTNFDIFLQKQYMKAHFSDFFTCLWYFLIYFYNMVKLKVILWLGYSKLLLNSPNTNFDISPKKQYMKAHFPNFTDFSHVWRVSMLSQMFRSFLGHSVAKPFHVQNGQKLHVVQALSSLPRVTPMHTPNYLPSLYSFS